MGLLPKFFSIVILLFVHQTAFSQTSMFVNHNFSVGGADYGRSGEFIGDLDGDGFSEYAIGAPLENGNDGSVYVYSGKDGTEYPGSPISGIGFRKFGSAISRLPEQINGDITGDGIPDFVVGAPSTQDGQSKVAVIDGSNLSVAYSIVPTSGPWTSTEFGHSLDVYLGNSFPVKVYLAIGAPTGKGYTVDPDGDTYRGRVEIHVLQSGSSSVITNGLIWPVQSNFPGAQNFGSAIAMDDLNGDLKPDLVVGAPTWPSSTAVSTRRNGGFWILMSPSYVATYGDGGINGQLQGSGVAIIPDQNSDGKKDVLVGGPSAGGNIAYVYASIGQCGNPSCSGGCQYLACFTHTTGSFGISVANVGDINGDGIEDFAVGANQDDLIAGDNRGSQTFYDGDVATGNALLAKIWGQEQNGQIGGSMARGNMDLNGDGFSDVIVPAPNIGIADTFSGKVLSLNNITSGGVHQSMIRTTGGTQTLTIDAGVANAGANYLVLGTKSGIHPGTSLFGAQIPLNVDGYFNSLLFNLTYVGNLDGSGQASIPIPVNPGVQSETQFYHSVVLYTVNPFNIHFVSNPVPLLVGP